MPTRRSVAVALALHSGARGAVLTRPVEKEIAMELVSSAENSSLDWNTKAEPGNPLAPFLPALVQVDGTDSHVGLGDPFIAAWHEAAKGGSEGHSLRVFLQHRKTIMRTEEAHSDTSRVDDEQLVFLKAHDWGLRPPLRWKTYGDPWSILTDPSVA